MAASQTMPVIRPNRRGIVAQWFALVGAAIAIGVIVALIVTWPDHGDSSDRGPAQGPAATKHAGQALTPASAAVKPRH
jgi:hypothetical protein